MSSRLRRRRRSQAEGILEDNVVFKDWRKVRLRVLITYPSSYRVGMSGLTIKLLYGLINNFDEYLAERAFADFPAPVSLESGRHPREFDVIVFTLQFEHEYAWLVRFLIKAGIHPYSKGREDKDPLIVVGGPCVMGNPAPIAEFVDVIVNGEAEPTLPTLLEVISNYDPPRKAVDELSSLPWAYVPARGGEPAKRRYTWVLDRAFFPVSQVITVDAPREYMPIYGRKYIVETSRGCGRGCRFCLSGYVFRPPRFRGLRRLEELSLEGVKRTPSDGIMIVGTAAGDAPWFPDYLEFLVSEGLRFSIPSIRADRVDERVARLIKRGGQRTLTIAPEVATDRMSRIINKKLSEDDVRMAIESAWKAGLSSVKLYFMIGLPYERDDDVASIPSYVQRVAGVYRPGRVKISITPFVPKPNTPFQWHGMESITVVEKRLKGLEAKLRRRGFVVEHPSIKAIYLEGVLARGGSELSKVILDVATSGRPTIGSWIRALRRHGLSLRDAEKPLRPGKEPWRRMVDSMVDYSYYLWEDDRAARGIETPGCNDLCLRCGVC